jgi:predicted aspartyl protease
VTIRIRFPFLDFDLITSGFVDTGFDGDVMLPPLRLPDNAQPVASRSFRSADGRVLYLPAYSGLVQVEGIDRTLPTSISVGTEEVLIGRGVLDHFRVTFDHGREVVVEP